MTPIREAVTVLTQTRDGLRAKPAESDAAGASDQADDAGATVAEAASTAPGPETKSKRRRRLAARRMIAIGVLPCIAMALGIFAGYAKWQYGASRDSQAAGTQAVQAAKDGAVALLGYQPDTVERDLTAARERLTGGFREAYTSLTHDVVIPGSKQKHISAVATVPAAGLVLATEKRAVVLIFVDQATTIGNSPPTNTASSLKVTLDRVANRWLISGFDPV
ncbi:hypothetical protein MSAS_17360 [Mycobacterium saskatchewanense]|nr:hypothetical protein MSAS_17360 [Mycobacterium saskatchewanense]